MISLNNFKDGQLILDMTGRSPGLIYAIKGKPLLSPWVIGGYSKSNKYLEYLLSKEKCKNLKNAWILIEPDGPRSLNQEYLLQNGINIKNDNNYKEVAKINFKNKSRSFGVMTSREDIKQYIYKPIKPHESDDEC